MIPILFIVLLLSTSYGFLLEKNNTGGAALTDQHYIHLLGLLTQEKENAQQMAQLILRLNNEVKSLQQVTGLNHGNGSSKEMTDLKNGYSALQKELIQVKQEINIMKNDNYALAKKNERLQSECSNVTMKLKTELETFTHSISASKLKNITQVQSSVESLEHKMDKTNTQLNSLISNSNARSQEFLALLNQTRDAQRKITILDTDTKQSLQSYQNSTNQKITTLESQTKHAKQSLQSYRNVTNQKITTLETQTKQSLQSYQNSTNQKFMTLETDFHSYQGSTNQKINEAFQRMTAINQTVVMTSCADGGSVSAGSVVKFSQTKTVYGVGDVSAFRSSGKFTCEVAGVYLFSVFIMSYSNPSEYSMYKNNDRITYVYIVGGSNNGSNFHTGTGIVAVSLNIGDTLYIKAYYKMVVYDFQSCMTIIKIR